MPTQDRVKIPRLPHPNVLLAGVSWHIGKSILAKDIIDEAGAIHSPIRWIGRAIRVIEILLRQIQTVLNDLPHLWRITVIFANLVRRNGGIWRTFFSRTR